MQETLEIITKIDLSNTHPSKEWKENFFQSLRSAYPFLRVSNSLKYRDTHSQKPWQNHKGYIHA